MNEIHDSWKSYKEVPVLKGINLNIPSQKKLIIMGRSGVGKSVLLRHITGLEKPDSGYVEVDGTRISELNQNELYKFMKNFGMLFQSSALFDSMTVEDNVAFYFNEHGTEQGQMPLSELSDRVADALNQVGLNDFQMKMPAELAGGQKRRAALARLIIYGPKVMLYDEPTTGLDPITAMQINELIEKTHEKLKATTVIVTHDLQSALFLGDLFALHHNGQIESVDEKRGFLTSTNLLIKEFFENALISPQKRGINV